MRITDLDTANEGLVSKRGGVAHMDRGSRNTRKLELVYSKDMNDAVPTGLIRQTTIAAEVSLCGIGLHKGSIVHLILKPAAADTGVVFRRTDLAASEDIPARFDMVCDTGMCTTLGNLSGASVATVEHLMAAISAMGLDNLVVEIDAHEVPVMDGSSDAFVEALDAVGLVELDAPRRFIRILSPIVLSEGLKEAVLEPNDEGFRIELGIDFENAVIGKQTLAVDITPDNFRDEIADCRTFGFLKDVELLYSLGLAKGASLDNAVVLDGEHVMNEDGLRTPDEFVRHKILDAVGDLALAGAPILGTYKGVRVGHAFNNQMLLTLFANPDAWEYVTLRHAPEPVLAQLAVSAD